MQCFSDSVHVTAHYYFAYVLYTGKNFDDLLTCFYIMIIPLSGLNIGMSLVFFIAFDRLVMMLFPLIHQRISKMLYLGTIFIICVIYNIYMLYIGYLNAKKNKNTMVVCMIIEGKITYVGDVCRRRNTV